MNTPGPYLVHGSCEVANKLAVDCEQLNHHPSIHCSEQTCCAFFLCRYEYVSFLVDMYVAITNDQLNSAAMVSRIRHRTYYPERDVMKRVFITLTRTECTSVKLISPAYSTQIESVRRVRIPGRSRCDKPKQVYLSLSP